MWLILLIILFLILIVQDLLKSRNILKLSQLILIPNIALPFIGHAYIFLGSDTDRMNALKTLGRESIKNGGFGCFWFGRKFYTTVSDAAVAEIVYKHFLDKPDVVSIVRKLIGNGLIFAPLEIWRPRRKLLAPTFSPKNLRHFVDIFNNQSAVLVKNLEPSAGAGIISIWNYVTAYTIESVCATALGVNMQSHSQQKFMNSFERYFNLMSARILQPWLHSDFMYKLLPSHTESINYRNFIWDFVDEIIKTKRQETKNREFQNEKNTDSLKTFLELLIERKIGDSKYSDEELREEILVIVLAGSDTSAVAISFIASVLSRYPEVQQKVYDELQEVFGDSDRPSTSADMAELKYLDAVVKETLRLYPPVPITIRSIDEDVQLPCGIRLIKNTGVLMHIWALHRNPRYWGSDAEEFNPDRFLEGELKHPCAFMPFSAGPRNCIGYQYAIMSIKTAISTLLRNYKLLPADPCNLKKQIPVKYGIMLRSLDEFALRLEKRQRH